jgi:hypothetical protein
MTIGIHVRVSREAPTPRLFRPADNGIATKVALDLPLQRGITIKASAEGARSAPPHLAEQLFDNAASLKILVSEIAMHLGIRWRDSIRLQIDSLLDIDAWEEESSQVDIWTFRTFLRFVVFSSPTKLPSLGVAQSGTFLASWDHNDQRVSVQFFRGDQVRAVLTKKTTRGKQTAAWQGPVADLADFVRGFGNEECLN